MKIIKALIIDEPWISKILCGEKIWEMRSRQTHHRGGFALIKKGTGKIFGVANLIDCKGPFMKSELVNDYRYHQIPESIINDPEYKWNHAWVLKNAIPLERPIPYTHQSGQVTWVELSVDERQELQKALHNTSTSNFTSTINLDNTKSKTHKLYESAPVTRAQSINNESPNLLPKAKDGTSFDRHCCNGKGLYTVGEKGEERKFNDFDEALHYLRKMPTAKWRRRNSNGNWGIVSAVEWVNS